jgi:hypothetical protein
VSHVPSLSKAVSLTLIKSEKRSRKPKKPMQTKRCFLKLSLKYYMRIIYAV